MKHTVGAIRRANHSASRSSDPELFMATFFRVREVALALRCSPLDLESELERTRWFPVMHAAAIEALASLRTEGNQL